MSLELLNHYSEEHRKENRKSKELEARKKRFQAKKMEPIFSAIKSLKEEDVYIVDINARSIIKNLEGLHTYDADYSCDSFWGQPRVEWRFSPSWDSWGRPFNMFCPATCIKYYFDTDKKTYIIELDKSGTTSIVEHADYQPLLRHMMKQIATQRVFYDSEKDAFWKEGKCNPPYYLKKKDNCIGNGPLYFRRKENGRSYIGTKYDSQWVCTGCISPGGWLAGVVKAMTSVPSEYKLFRKEDLKEK